MTAVLSLCIPTWNRAKYLGESLNRLRCQLSEMDSTDIEIFVSDNASDDNTQDVVSKCIDEGMPITYNRNETNIGAARNFLRCIQRSHGKYIWLLGDDDFLKPNALKILVETLKNDDYGLLHLYMFGNRNEVPEVYTSPTEFAKRVSFYATFMSGNIFNRSSVSVIESPEQYIDSHLLQMPFYLESMFSHEKNVLIGFNQILEPAADSASNGGYNFFDVFVNHYLTMWHVSIDRHRFDKSLYNFIRDHIFKNFTIKYTLMLLVYKQNISVVEEKKYSRKGWRVDNGWKFLFKYYGHKFYFYRMTLIPMARHSVGILFRKLHLLS